MAGRRKRKKHIFPKIILFLCVIAVAAGAVTTAGWSLPRLFRAVGETVNTAAQPQAEFPELTVSVEEVDGSFYYQQLSEKEADLPGDSPGSAGNAGNRSDSRGKG